MTQSLTIPTQAIEFGIGAWIHEKFGHTKSEKTRTAYSETITAFRQLLQREGLDLAWPASQHESDAQIRQRLSCKEYRQDEGTGIFIMPMEKTNGIS